METIHCEVVDLAKLDEQDLQRALYNNGYGMGVLKPNEIVQCEVSGILETRQLPTNMIATQIGLTNFITIPTKVCYKCLFKSLDEEAEGYLYVQMKEDVGIVADF